MSLIYITGPTASGKSTVCEILRERGYKAYDSDDEDMRRRIKINGKDLLYLDGKILQQLHNKSKGHTFFICGTSPNDMDYKDLFSKIILLAIDEDEQRKRILSRTNNDYGKNPKQLKNALKWRSVQIDKYLEAGAVEIGSSISIDKVIDRILEMSKHN